MGSSKSKIPPQVPGQYLFNTGVREFDSLFEKAEGPLKQLKEVRTELDMFTTDFVRHLGAEKHWELNPDLKHLCTMMLVVLAAEGNGNLECLGISYSAKPPYIHISEENLKKLRKRAKATVESFIFLMDYLQTIAPKLEPLTKRFNRYAQKVKPFPKEIARKTESLNYNMRDKLQAVKNTNFNYTEITNAPSLSRDMIGLSEECKASVIEACEEVQRLPYSDLLISRSVQAASEGLRKPKSIVDKFWPIN